VMLFVDRLSSVVGIRLAAFTNDVQWMDSVVVGQS